MKNCLHPTKKPKTGCVGTAYPASPNITRTSEKSAINPSLTPFTFSLTIVSLLCQLSTLRTFLFLKIIADAGVGKKMFSFLKVTAKREGCGRIEFIVLKWNKSAQEFYEKNGAKRLEWFFYRVVKDDF